jgi:CBS domain containing-hemolysin-like protein
MRRQATAVLSLTALAALGAAAPAHASLFSGDTLDFVADILAWVVLVIAPVIAISVFWLVHILPEKIAEKRHHPQAPAIKTLCLLSLFFGGLLWPLAWLWAYSQPVLYKLAYGVDKVKPAHEDTNTLMPSAQPAEAGIAPGEVEPEEPEVVPEPVPRVTRAATRERRPWEA